MGSHDEVAGRRPRPRTRPGAAGGAAAPGTDGRVPSVFARVGRTGGSPASVPGKYKGPIGPVDRRETTVLAFMYVTLVTLIACGISPEAAVAGATTAGAAAARLLGLL